MIRDLLRSEDMENLKAGGSSREAEDAKWLGADELDSVKWFPADLELIEYIRYKLLTRL